MVRVADCWRYASIAVAINYATSAPSWRPQRPKTKPGIADLISGRPDGNGLPLFSFGLLAWTPVEANLRPGSLLSRIILHRSMRAFSIPSSKRRAMFACADLAGFSPRLGPPAAAFS